MSKELDNCFDDFGRVKGNELKEYLKSKLEFSEEKAEKVSEGIVAAQEMVKLNKSKKKAAKEEVKDTEPEESSESSDKEDA